MVWFPQPKPRAYALSGLSLAQSAEGNDRAQCEWEAAAAFARAVHELRVRFRPTPESTAVLPISGLYRAAPGVRGSGNRARIRRQTMVRRRKDFRHDDRHD